MQTLSKKYQSFVSDMKNAAGDSKVHATIKGGLHDGSVDDDKISIKKSSVKVSKLRPTQNEIDIDKSLSWPLQKNAAMLGTFLKGNNVTIMAPIITLNNKWIIDGHHRWSQVYAFNAQATMACANLSMPGLNPIEGLKVVQTAIAATMGTIPQASVKGTNLLKASEDTVKKEVLKLMSAGSEGPKALRWLKKFNKIKNNEGPAELADYVWQQIKVMQSKSQPAPGAPARGFMPQTDQPPGGMPKLAQLLKKGVVNWNDPF